ncbi:class I SAM-dependent methyltransferase [Pseudomonas gingeri]|uniref:Class I SAM-dependent methyltransferase n=1 Tax=Pseudomonas gingeri TaxID=117681 RepID=A0A7Y7YJF1_9PSED|nr:class I SAM-dependent methyltransferase [Pseudomonas gingeri]NWA00784.1 class I SAM-dependent methyltransferase [Pseudomonas gingeri]NWA16172.1 class I SAM-dependent methyltransferase [Pseudomonas gingeri]NWA54362.1 class I SAM-dependent methyltransferase [Pseudomonas gingeri]NWA97561.1 class I SAM-dependent methyltransferase [Pseudomonas gingeri]NWB04367.1 class I SAM-dependent methyltransferase [Pseudomonas gingeri]
MSAQPPSLVELEFARHHAREHARVYREIGPEGLLYRLGYWRERQLMRHALKIAGEPGLVLDLPCGSGRFWSVLAERGNRVVLAADSSQDMLDHCAAHHSLELLKRVRTFQSSVFAIGLPENAVDCIFCVQLFAYVADKAQRLAMLREFHRVSRDTVIVSLWVDGNVMAWRRRRLAAHSGLNSQRVVLGKALIEAEFQEAGFEIVGHRDFLPGYAMRRVYVLRKDS